MPPFRPIAFHVAFAFAFAWAPAASADDLATGGGITRIIDAQVTTRIRSGIPAACEVTYTIGYEDRVSRGGAMVLLRGSVSINRAAEADKVPSYVILKVAALDFDGMTFAPAPIYRASLLAGERALAGQDAPSFQCEDEGLCVIYDGGESLAKVVGDGFRITYSRERSGSAVTVPLNLARTRPQVAEDLAVCVKAIEGEPQDLSP